MNCFSFHRCEMLSKNTLENRYFLTLFVEIICGEFGSQNNFYLHKVLDKTALHKCLEKWAVA